MPSVEEIQDAQRATWAKCSAGRDKDEVISGQLDLVSAANIDSLDIEEDHQHLDIAASTGEPGLSIARLAPKGRIVSGRLPMHRGDEVETNGSDASGGSLVERR